MALRGTGCACTSPVRTILLLTSRFRASRCRSRCRKVWMMPYQVYANGRYIGQLGNFSARRVKLYYSKPLSFPLPAPGPDGEIELAVRFYMSPSSRFSAPDVGGMHGPPALGLPSTVRLLQAAEDDADLHSAFGRFLRTLIFLLIAPLALWGWLRNWQERMYLWLFLALASTILFGLEVNLAYLSFALTIAADIFLGNVLLNSLILPSWIMFWWHWFGLREKHWIPWTAWLLTAAYMLAQFWTESHSSASASCRGGRCTGAMRHRCGAGPRWARCCS
jgi:hypothetical protein